MNDDERMQQGKDVRRQILGAEMIDRAMAVPAGLRGEFRDLMTRFAWGEVWARPGLDLRTRSAATIAALVALRQEKELAIHLQAGLNNGLTWEEINEILIHTAVYCGAPAAASAFDVAEQTLGGAEQA